jgi:Amt family ammonium transporter
MAWMMVCTALVMLMAPGMGFFYSGVSGRRSALSMIWLSLMAMAVVGIQVTIITSDSIPGVMLF